MGAIRRAGRKENSQFLMVVVLVILTGKRSHIVIGVQKIKRLILVLRVLADEWALPTGSGLDPLKMPS